MEIKEFLLEQILKRVKYLEEKEDEFREDYGREYEYPFSYYDLGCTEGEPHSMGNFNDCYDDGFNNGIEQGELDMLRAILKWIEINDGTMQNGTATG
jgi:hypothetical protein